jgi:putative effector of murein hydrolase LrgA (UPF0299 family)
MNALFRFHKNGRALRGQSFAEFALVVGVLTLVTLFLLMIVPALQARSVVLDAAAIMTERAGLFMAPSGVGQAAQEGVLCNQLLAVARMQLSSAGYPTTGGNSGCAALGAKPAAGNNPIVYVSSSGNLATNPDPANFNQPEIKVCLLYQTSVGFWQVGNISYQFCGRAVISATRTR